MKYVFDIDGTICTDTNGDYCSAQPIIERINKINSLYREGHQIILFTARGMGSSDNNWETAHKKWKNFTENQLCEWGVKYHQLFLGKPAGDVYVDDKGMHDKIFFNEYA
jgi:histidinol phosphatase-like enzyme